MVLIVYHLRSLMFKRLKYVLCHRLSILFNQLISVGEVPPLHSLSRSIESASLVMYRITDQSPVPEDTHSNYSRHVAQVSLLLSSASGLSTRGTV